MSRYRYIRAERATYPIVVLCQVLQGARSAYYAWARRGVSARAQADQALTAQIATVHTRSRRTYGAPRVHAELRAQGVRCARKRVDRLMRAAGLVGCHRWRRTRTTVCAPSWRSTRSQWPSVPAARMPASCITPIAAASTPRRPTERHSPRGA